MILINKFLLKPIVLVLMVFIYGCQSVVEGKICNNKKEILKGNSEDNILLNLDLPLNQLIKSIQSQTSLDLCTNPNLNAEMLWLNEKYEFSMMVFKECGRQNHSFTPINIHFDHRRNVIVNNHSVDFSGEKISSFIQEITKKTQHISTSKEIVYLLEWDIGMDSEILKYGIVEILEGISKYFENISMEKFNKSICELDVYELRQIDSLFHGIIGFTNQTKMGLPYNPQE